MSKNKITSAALATLIYLSLANGNAYAAEEEEVYVPANLQGQAFLIDVNGKIIIDENNNFNLHDKSENIEHNNDEVKINNIVKEINDEDVTSKLDESIKNNENLDDTTDVIIISEAIPNYSNNDQILEVIEKNDLLVVADKTELDEYEENNLKPYISESVDVDNCDSRESEYIPRVENNYIFDKEGTPEWLKNNKSYELPKLDNSINTSFQDLRSIIYPIYQFI